MSDADTLRAMNKMADWNVELKAELFKASWERMCLLAERRKWKQRTEHAHQWYAERFEAIKAVAQREGLWDEVAAIFANGSGTRTLQDGTVLYDPPTYGQQMNRALHRAERAETDAFNASWERGVLLCVIELMADNTPDAKFQAALAVAYMEGARDGANPVTEYEIAFARHMAKTIRDIQT